MQTQIKHIHFYSASPDTIWEFLTDSALLSQWLMKNDIQPVLGHSFMFNTNAMPDFDFDGKIYCEILELVPMRKLAYSWKGGNGDGHINMDTVVTWTLTEKNGGTELLLEHTGFDETINKAIFQAMHGGWNKNMGKIETIVTKQTTDETTASK